MEAYNSLVGKVAAAAATVQCMQCLLASKALSRSEVSQKMSPPVSEAGAGGVLRNLA
jgi:hypothetical protein